MTILEGRAREIVTLIAGTLGYYPSQPRDERMLLAEHLVANILRVAKSDPPEPAGQAKEGR